MDLLKKWEISAATEGLLFFAQSLDQLCFDHTIDSYRAPALNLHSSALEVSALAKFYSGNESLAKTALASAIEELHTHLKNDPVLRIKQKVVAKRFVAFIKTELRPIEIHEYAEALIAEIRSFYWEAIQQCIIEAVADGKRKQDILQLATAFVGEVELRAYPRGYLYRSNKEFFFLGGDPEKITQADQIREFLGLFNGAVSRWTVVLKANSAFERYSKYHASYGFKLTPTAPRVDGVSRYGEQFLALERSDDRFLIFGEILAKCPHAAREIAFGKLEHFADTVKLHFHSGDLSWQGNCITIQEALLNDSGEAKAIQPEKKVFLLKEPTSPMKSGVYVPCLKPIFNLEKCAQIIEKQKFTRPSLSAFYQLLEYHRAALDGKWHENQLINLWAGLEGFCNQAPPGQSRINHYKECLIPSLGMAYIVKLTQALSDGLRNTDQATRDLVSSIDVGDHFSERCLALLTCEDLRNERIALYSMLNRYPLLRYRCNQFHSRFETTSKICSSLEQHIAKVSWHIQRIYTSRNQIVHNARSFPYLSTLIQNLHSYIDPLIEGVTSIVHLSPHPLSVGSAMKILEVTYSVQNSRLKEANVTVKKDNFKDYLIGTDNPFDLYDKSFS
jgi:hypothetical protein